MNKLVWMFTFVDSVIVLAFQLLGLTVLWSFAGAGDGIWGLALMLGATSVFRALFALVRGYIVDSFQKKTSILASLMVCGLLSIVWFFGEYFLLIAIIAYIAIEFAKELYSSSYAALVAEKLSADEYIKYDSVSIMAGRIIAVIGNLVAAIMVSFLSVWVIVVLVVVVFAIGVLVCLRYLPRSSVERSEPTVRVTLDFAKKNVFGDRKVIVFIVIIFLLNLDYAFIPTLLPMFIITATELASPLLFGIIRAGNNIGEFAASGVVLKYSHLVFRLTKIGLGGSAIVFLLLPFIYTMPVLVVVFFALYSFFDMLTQPMYSWFVSSLEDSKRGRVLGIVDSIILLASPLGILLGATLSSLGMYAVSIGIVAVFLSALVAVSKSKSLR